MSSSQITPSTTIVPLTIMTRAKLIDGEIVCELTCGLCFEWVFVKDAVHLSQLSWTPRNAQSKMAFCKRCGNEKINECEIVEVMGTMKCNTPN